MKETILALQIESAEVEDSDWDHYEKPDHEAKGPVANADYI